MLFEREMIFTGAESRPSFKDPSKMTNEASFMAGIDQYRTYVDDNQLRELIAFPIMSPVVVTIDINFITKRVNYRGFRPLEPVHATADKSGKSGNNS